ncbi:MAG: leucyl/phenylalanyl-tRNA--protein transferase [Cytophagales bacterium]|nr:MAG: leucyl/phenylalanyl-tRNA--protein transferase [Cytophagales bacterium]
MPIFELDSRIWFPNIYNSEPDGLLAFGGDLSSERLLLAYKSGIFPWYNAHEPILWWSPNPRFVLFPNDLKISKTTQQLLNQNKFKVTINQCFKDVMFACGQIFRPGQDSTWITDDMLKSYQNLHNLGFAHSIEVWQNNNLVGGLYGIKIGTIFFGESMFSLVSNSSKIGFITLIKNELLGKISLIDCQVHTNHLESLGAKMISRIDFTNYLKSNI